MPFVISGASLTDTVFTTDAAVFGEEICWNVTRIQVDATAGKFGAPERIPMARLPPMPATAYDNLDWDKISGMLAVLKHGQDTAKLRAPILQVLVTIGQTLYRIPIDGNHRLTALRLFGQDYFECYVVPAEMEHRYRATMRSF
jgi:hypothetical protein